MSPSVPIAYSPQIQTKKPRKKLLLIIPIVLLLLGGAAAAVFVPKLLDKEDKSTKNSTSSNNDSEDENKSEKISLDSIQSQDDLAALGEEGYKSFCAEVVKLDPEGQEIKDLNERLGLGGGLYDDIYLGCQLSIVEEEYIAKDKSGKNDDYYRRGADEAREIASDFTFDLYDVNYEVEDLGLSARSAASQEGEASNLRMEYSTLTDGGFSPYSSDSVIRIYVFDVTVFPQYTNNCGPTLMSIKYAYQENSEECTKTTETFEGQPIYKSEGLSNDSYSVTLGETRILVGARSQEEAVAVIKSMKKVTVDELDFFIKN